MRTIILAGGYATHLCPITASRAKPLLPVAGKPIVDYLLDSYIEATQRYANADTWQGKDVVIENSVVKDSVLFDGVRIADVSITGCVIDRGAHLDGVTLSDCLIGENAIVKRS